MKKIGFIGYGLRSETMMKAFRALEAEIRVAAVADPAWREIAPKVREDPYFAGTAWYDSGEEMLQREELDGVFIGTRCSLHTEYACLVLRAGLPLFLEKPVCISREQYDRLREAGRGRESSVVVSFPLRVSPIVEEMKRIADSGLLGKITMAQAVNNVPYGSVYYHSWYRDPKETGGLFLQKATHDVDYIRYLMGERPVSVCAKTAKLHFRGDRPAGLTCPECPEYHSCRESSYMVEHIYKEEVQGDRCCFAVDTGNEDAASMILQTESGALITYSQIFMVKKGAARRGVRLIGTEASAEFDFNTGVIREDRYDTPQTVTHTFQFASGQHFGGDEALARDFLRVLEGEKARSDLKAGLESAAVCLTAREADGAGRFLPIIY